MSAYRRWFPRKKTAKALRQHFKKRALTRYDLELTNEDLHKIAKMIQEQKAIFIERTSLSRTKWLLTYEGAEFIVIYDKNFHTVVTALPKESE